jgi:hypothetical protein
MRTDIKHNANMRPRGKMKQLGSSIPLTTYSRPILQRLEIYENVFNNDPTLIQAVNVLTDALIGSLGEVEHPDSDIQEFLQLSIDNLSDNYSINLRDKIKEIITITMWAGFSVTENIYEIIDGTVLLKDLVTYHPSTLIIRTDKKGRLVEGAPSYEGVPYLSGIYQSSYDSNAQGEVKLPMWKIIYLAHKKQFNNYYGSSIVEPIYRWHVLKEAFVDMLTVTLDKYGKPMTVFSIPRRTSAVSEFDPITEEDVRLTDAQILQKQLEDAEGSGDINNIILEYSDNEAKPEVQVVQPPSNINAVFLEAIKFCEKQQIKLLLLPYGIVDGDISNEMFSERQVEFFNRVISSMYTKFVIPFVNQSLHRLVKLNFDREAAKYPPQIPLRKGTRPEARVALMQMIKGLTEQGYFNPLDNSDWAMVRQLVDCLDRPMTDDDKEFIRQLLVYPKQPKEGTPSSTTNRKSEGKIKGKAQQGRPTGVSVPLQQARPKNKDS